MKFTRLHIFGIVFSLIIVVADFIFFFGEPLFVFLMGIAFAVLLMPFIFTLIVEGNREKEKDERFLEFSRNLAESVKTGTPIGASIINMQTKDYGSLSPHVRKLANQIALGIPLSKALDTFAYEVNSNTIRRAISLIRESENAGGEIDNILDSVAESIQQVEKLKKERKAAIYNLVVQGYIIFLIFVCIMLVMEFKILPLTAGIGSIGALTSGGTSALSSGDLQFGSGASPEELARPFLYLLIVQGIFAGLTIGKLAEGSVKAGIKHSFILALAAFLISSGARLVLGAPTAS